MSSSFKTVLQVVVLIVIVVIVLDNLAASARSNRHSEGKIRYSFALLLD